VFVFSSARYQMAIQCDRAMKRLFLGIGHGDPLDSIFLVRGDLPANMGEYHVGVDQAEPAGSERLVDLFLSLILLLPFFFW